MSLNSTRSEREPTLRNVVKRIYQEDTSIEQDKALEMLAEIDREIERKCSARRGFKLTGKVYKARQDVLIYCEVVALGWGKARRRGRTVIVEDCPLTVDQRLGYPTRSRIARAVRRVRATSPEEAAEYRRAYRDWAEARRRYIAASTEEDWRWYVRGDGNHNSVAYRSKVDSYRRGGIEHFRKRRGFRYLLHELLPREQELKRAAIQMSEADTVMTKTRDLILEKMNVPPEYRSYV